MALVEINIVPVGTDSASFSSYVAACYKELEKEKGLKHQLTPTSTVIEGDLDQVLDAVKRMHQIPFGRGAARVITNITIDERMDKSLSMEDSVQTVMQEIH
ncbi:MAG: MTH1187 family thiamine-binding protein [Bacillota bacterium]